MSYINYNLANPADIANGVWQSFDRGRDMARAAQEMKDKREYRSALGVLATDPENKNALTAVFQQDPRTGAQLMDRADDLAFRREAGNWVTGERGNALAGVGPAMSPSQPNALNPALPQVQPNATFDEAFAPVADPPSPEAPDAAQPGPDVSALGEPQDRRDEAFLRMLQRDPVRALKIKSAMRDNFVDQAKAESEFYTLAIGELGRATDQATWNAGLQAVMPRAQALGFDVSQVIPEAFPGTEGVQALMERALPVKEQLDYLLREANQEADNTRADRNTDSSIEVREGRLAETRRVNNARLENQRRGQNIRADTSRQNTRDRVSARPPKSSGKKPQRAEVVTVQTPAEAQALKPGTRYRRPGSDVVMVR